jgi:hypothetical protein
MKINDSLFFLKLIFKNKGYNFLTIELFIKFFILKTKIYIFLLLTKYV